MTRRYCPEPVDQENPLVLPAVSHEQRLHALQDAVAMFETEFKRHLLDPLTYPEPPRWLKPLTRGLNAALRASKVE